MFRTSLWSSEVRCEVQKFISEFTSQFVNKGCDWLLNSMKPIKCLVYKPACEFWNELLNFATNFRTSQRSSESYNEKLPEIDCNCISKVQNQTLMRFRCEWCKANSSVVQAPHQSLCFGSQAEQNSYLKYVVVLRSKA